MTFEIFRLQVPHSLLKKASILKTSIVIFGIKNHFNTLHHNPFLLSFDSVFLIISMIRIMSFSLSYLPVYPLQLFAGMKNVK